MNESLLAIGLKSLKMPLMKAKNIQCLLVPKRVFKTDKLTCWSNATTKRCIKDLKRFLFSLIRDMIVRETFKKNKWNCFTSTHDYLHDRIVAMEF